MASLSNPANIKKLLDAQTLSINSNVDTKTAAVDSTVSTQAAATQNSVATKAAETQSALIADNDVTQAQLNGMTTVNGTLDTNVTAINGNTDAQHVTTKALVTSEADRVIAATPSSIKSIQRGGAVVNISSQLVVNVSPVNINKSFLIINTHGGWAVYYYNGSNGIQLLKGSGKITSATTITLYADGAGTYTSGTNPTVEWELIEYA